MPDVKSRNCRFRGAELGEWTEIRDTVDAVHAARRYAETLIDDGDLGHDDAVEVEVQGEGTWIVRTAWRPRIVSVEKVNP
jgi:hypothetical protein